MVDTIPDILARIVARKRDALDQVRAQRRELERAAQSRIERASTCRDFRAAW